MKYIFLLLTISLAFTFNSFSQDLSQPKGGGTLDIVLISPDDGHSIMNFEGQISGYGSVFVKFKVSSINTSKNKWNFRWSRKNYPGRWSINYNTLKRYLEKKRRTNEILFYGCY